MKTHAIPKTRHFKIDTYRDARYVYMYLIKY